MLQINQKIPLFYLKIVKNSNHVALNEKIYLFLRVKLNKDL